MYSSLHYIYSISYILLSLDNDVLATSKRGAIFYNILSQIFIVKCFTKSLLIKILIIVIIIITIVIIIITIIMIPYSSPGLCCCLS